MRLLLLILLFITHIAFAQKNPVITNKTLDSMALANSKLENRIETLERNSALDREVDSKYYDSIANQLSSSSYSLTIFGILFSLGAIAFGIYVTWVERKIVKLREENTSLLKQTKEVKDEVVETNRLIHEDINGLYLKIKNEETNYIINRLENVPEDIGNLVTNLLSRDLDKSHFPKLRDAFYAVQNEETYYTDYLALLFQHFPEQSMGDPIIHEKIIFYMNGILGAFFKNDIINTSRIQVTNATFWLKIKCGEKKSNLFLGLLFSWCCTCWI